MSLLDVIATDTAEIIGGDFSEAVTIAYDDGTALDRVTVSTRGIFDSTFQEINPDTGAAVMSANSRITLAQDEIEEAIGQEIVEDEHDYWTFTVRGIDYRPRSVQSDGTGLVLIVLRKIET